jgi:hypothetical protein
MVSYGLKEKFALLNIGRGERKRRKRKRKIVISRKGRREMGKYVLGQCHFGQSLS